MNESAKSFRSNGQSTSQFYRPDIDGLRGIAVLLVVIFHFWPNALPGGFVGVDIFFVISGYLITRIILKNRGSRIDLQAFYARRLRRLAPTIIVVSLSVLVSGFFLSTLFDYQILSSTTFASAAFAANFDLWARSSYFDPSAQENEMLHMWSLGVEEQFYIFWPLAAFLFPLRSLRVDLKLCIAILVGSFLIGEYWLSKGRPAAFYLLPGRMWELSIGGTLAILHAGHWLKYGAANNYHATDKSPHIGMAPLSACVGLTLIAVSVLVLNGESAYPGWRALLPTMGAVFIIQAGPATWINAHLIGSRPLRAVGLISFQIYVWHWPLIVMARKLGFIGLHYDVGLAALLVALSWGTWRFVERPFRFATQGGVLQTRLGAFILVAGLAVVGITAYLAPGIQKASLRLPVWAQDMIDFKFDLAAYRGRRCLLDIDQSSRDFGQECRGDDATGQRGDRPLLLLWGDSHAAHLLPGLKTLQGKLSPGFRISQFTMGGCPPLFDVEIGPRPNCRELNNFIKKELPSIKPDIVVLAAQYTLYNGTNKWPKIDWTHLTETILWLRKVGVKRVFVVGPVPTWKGRLPNALVESIRFKNIQRPRRWSTYLAEIGSKMALEIRRNVELAGGEYLSALDVLCNSNGCITVIEGAGGLAEPVVWDDSHLTGMGSNYLVRKLLEKKGL